MHQYVCQAWISVGLSLVCALPAVNSPVHVCFKHRFCPKISFLDAATYPHPLVRPSVCLSVSPSLCRSLRQSISPLVYLTVRLSVRPLVHPMYYGQKCCFFVYKPSFFAPKHHFSPISWVCSFLKLIFTDSSCFFMSVSPVSTKLFFEFWPKSQFSLFFFLQQQPNWKSLLKSLAVCKSVGLWPQHLKAIHHT